MICGPDPYVSMDQLNLQLQTDWSRPSSVIIGSLLPCTRQPFSPCSIYLTLPFNDSSYEEFNGLGEKHLRRDRQRSALLLLSPRLAT